MQVRLLSGVPFFTSYGLDFAYRRMDMDKFYADMIARQIEELQIKTDCHAQLYDALADLIQTKGGYKYSDGTTAMLGAYSGVLDFEVVKECLAHVPDYNEKIMLEALDSITGLTPIHHLLYLIAKPFFENRVKV